MGGSKFSARRHVGNNKWRKRVRTYPGDEPAMKWGRTKSSFRLFYSQLRCRWTVSLGGWCPFRSSKEKQKPKTWINYNTNYNNNNLLLYFSPSYPEWLIPRSGLVHLHLLLCFYVASLLKWVWSTKRLPPLLYLLRLPSVILLIPENYQTWSAGLARTNQNNYWLLKSPKMDYSR